ncbi:MAG TPA: amino acid ABC transporter [Sulfurimonas autotrophica]|uniref:Amino acid ABC transporter n=1 Tax=Sulfurimonas autotrophica TaxID=202747 RepID=A0A7C3C7B1_9BACT|nr:amino acid ABC transporter [Sulfurimonas autotrophica]
MKLPKISISTNIMMAFGLFFILFASLFIYLSYYYADKLAREATQNNFRQLSRSIKSHLDENYDEIKNIMGILSLDSKSSYPVEADRLHPLYPVMKYLLKEHSYLNKMYVADKHNNMFTLIAFKSEGVSKQLFHVPKAAHYLAIVTIKGMTHYLFLDNNDVILAKRTAPSDVTPQTQPWYAEVQQRDTMVFTQPYILTYSKRLGVSFTKKIGHNIFGIDMNLESFNNYLAHLTSKNIRILLYNDALKSVYASSSSLQLKKLPQGLQAIIDSKRFDTIVDFELQGRKYYLLITPSSFMKHDLIISYVPQKVILQPYIKRIEEMSVYIMAIIILSIPFIILFSRLLRKPIIKLIGENERIQKRRFDEVKRIDTFIKEFDELSQSQYEMAHEIRAYQKSQEELLNSIIKLIAEAIDAKSLYTGEHCKRVPEIAKMLLDKANEDETLFKDFHFEGADNYRAFEIGSWLHDCGKLTTPEYVMDKSTKLETLYNRIHEIRTRFEVLLRDAKIHEYEVILAGGEREKANAAYEAMKKELMEEFALIAKVNIGAESMDTTEKAKIQKIASREWVRNFDNTLGLSQEELERLREESITLPQREKLLDDKASHIIKRRNFDYEAYKREGFKLEVPEYEYNLGEIYNLCVERGTLNAEERYKIQEHVIMTIKMLEQIPFPKELQNVPKYAGTHHETLIGTGYPRKLTQEELSIPERIMAVADIFEALTASDRPYKKAKTLWESLHIMSFMVKDKHIDKDIFILFLRSGVYLAYAQAHLREEQIDRVDIDKLIKEIS